MLKYEELINELRLIHSCTKDQTTRTRIYNLLARVMDGIELTNVQQQAIYRKMQHSYCQLLMTKVTSLHLTVGANDSSTSYLPTL